MNNALPTTPMKITRLILKNYRTFEDFDLSFPSYYSAICGRNDSGKTHLVRAVRTLMEDQSQYRFRDQEEFSFKDDFTKWKTGSDRKRVEISAEVSANKETDAGLYEFITTYLSLTDQGDTLNFKMDVVYDGETPLPQTNLTVGTQKFEGIKAEEVLKKLQSSHAVLFHNSTETDPQMIFSRGVSGVLSEFSGRDSAQVDKLKKNVDRALSKIAKRQQTGISELIGRLESKHKVGMSMHAFDIGYLPFTITLGDKEIALSLDDWGSGTRNRTLILMTLLRARQISQGGPSASKITPIIVIEEPESFLHPSAQAEFGGILQDLSEEFNVQVLATTHSPYMLRQDEPSSNILLERRVIRRQLRRTDRVATSPGNWMEPFGRALGIDNAVFEPWKELFLKKTKNILLVEGKTDVAYFQLLRAPAHGSGQLLFDGEIFPYGGFGNLKNTVLLKFIREKYERMFVTYDLDREKEVMPSLVSAGLKKNRDFFPIGLSGSGKQNIEGLVPDSVTSRVHSAHTSLVQQAMHGTTEEKNAAKEELKQLIYKEFASKARVGDEFFRKFYDVTRAINKAMR
jgi:putative ATP-dependent endonuclease of OLD family